MRPLLLLPGPTASGKSALALALCERYDGEIVTVDSAQVYRGMDIGTAKPDAAERARVPHHLLDLCDPAEAYSAARFAADAAAAIADIRSRGRVPVLAGGTMLYFRALCRGLSALPAADPALRARIEARAAREGWPALHAELARQDPETAARLHPNDRARIQRALEICHAGGRPASAQRDGGHAPELGPRLAIVWAPQSRQGLAERIASRFDAMVASGLVEEVAALHARGDLHAELPALRAVGYRQIWQFLEGQCDWQTARQRALAATRQLAKRQLTWLNAGLVERELVRHAEWVFNARSLVTTPSLFAWCDARL